MDVGERKRILAMILPKILKKIKLWQLNYWNLKIKKEKRKKENWTVARVMLRPQTILPYFYKLLLWPIFYWFLSWPTNNIIFLFTNNHSLHQQFIKVFVKKFVSLAFCQKWRIKKRKQKKTNSIIMRLEFRQFNCHNWSVFFF